jgi:hypothetical protein
LGWASLHDFPETLPRRDEARRQGSDSRPGVARRERLFDRLITDLIMMVMPGGMERTKAELRALLTSTGFKFSRVVPDEIDGERRGSNQVGAKCRLPADPLICFFPKSVVRRLWGPAE